MPEYNEQVVKRSSKKSWLKIFIILLITHLAVGFGGWKIGSDAKKVQVTGLVTELSAKDVAAYVKKVSALMAVPKSETPKVVVLNNVDEIAKQQPFFIGAKNGDVFLVYNESKKAIIYRPSENLIINVGPVYGEPEKKQPEQVQNSTTPPAQDNDSASTNTGSEQKKTTEATSTKSIKN